MTAKNLLKRKMNYIECKDKRPYDDSQRKKEVVDYISEHKINELIHNLTSLILYYKPESPRRFMIEQLEILEQAQEGSVDPPSLFSDRNIEAMFMMLDPTDQGIINISQYREAMKALGITEYDQFPIGGDNGTIRKDTFINEAKHGLRKMTASFCPK